MKIYNVAHVYDVDGGYGDAVTVEDFVAAFEREEDATAFVEKYSKPYVYYAPYAELYCNKFAIIETEVVTHSEFNIDKTPKEYGIWLPNKEEV